MKIKIGRNDKCPCGSNKKYKKCCLELDRHFEDAREIPKPVKEMVVKSRIEDFSKKQAGLFIDFVKPIIYSGKKVWALGNKVYYERPPNESFHDFIIFILMSTLGNDWWNTQKKLPEEEIHFIAKSYLKYIDFKKRNCPDENCAWSALPDGWTRLMMALAFDVCSLLHASKIPESLLKRLRNKNEYQGARYEIMIAGIFARLGYKIKFLDEKDKKHCEFIASLQNGVSIAVEVKSRHRAGIIHNAGTIDEEKITRGDVDRLLREALEQNPGDMPFLVFIDVNSPMTPTIKLERKKWFKDIETRLKSIYKKPNPKNPEPFNGLIFTNHSFHYQEEKEANPGEYFCLVARYPKYPFPDTRYIQVIANALEHYGNVPDLTLKKEYMSPNTETVDN